MDGWCTDRILFSIPVPSEIDFFSLPFLSPDLSLFLQLYFLPAPPPGIFLFFAFKTFPTHQPPLSPTNPLTYIFKLKGRLFPIYLPTYKLKMCYSHPHPPTHPPSIYLPIYILGRYLQNATYMVTPTYHPGWHSNRPSPIDPQRLKTMKKE
jgi:hypothetical protein